jgi:uncharacterized protein YcnI
MRSKTAATALVAGAVLLGSAAAAQAHISLHPNYLPAGSFATLNVRVPGEQQGAYAYKVDMLLPPGFTSVDTQNVPGWSVTEVLQKLATPLQTDSGPVSEEVSQVIWTGDRSKLGRIDNGSFIQFPLSVAIPTNATGQTLTFKTLQYYSNAQVVRWIGPPSADTPAPTIEVTKAGGVLEDIAGGEAGPKPGEQPTGQTSSSAPTASGGGGKASTGLAVAGLVVGALGLVAGGLALLATRRKQAA